MAEHTRRPDRLRRLRATFLHTIHRRHPSSHFTLLSYPSTYLPKSHSRYSLPPPPTRLAPPLRINDKLFRIETSLLEGVLKETFVAVQGISRGDELL